MKPPPMEATTYAEDVGIYLTIEGIATSTISPMGKASTILPINPPCRYRWALFYNKP